MKNKINHASGERRHADATTLPERTRWPSLIVPADQARKRRKIAIRSPSFPMCEPEIVPTIDQVMQYPEHDLVAEASTKHPEQPVLALLPDELNNGTSEMSPLAAMEAIEREIFEKFLDLSQDSGTPEIEIIETLEVDRVPNVPFFFRETPVPSREQLELELLAVDNTSTSSEEVTSFLFDLPDSSHQNAVASGSGSQASTFAPSPETVSPHALTAPPTKSIPTIDLAIHNLVQPTDNIMQAVVENYLRSTPPLEINPPPLSVEVPRDFLRLAYGGSDQSFLQNFHANKNPSGNFVREVVFPTLSLNPYMPSSPGHSGLVFASRHEILENGPWTLFCKKSNATPVVWEYQGEYENVIVGTLTAEQYCAQTLQVQREWATSVLTSKRYTVYVEMRARIALRKAAVLPVTHFATAEEIEKETQSLIAAEVKQIKRNQGIHLERDEIVTAFRHGEEAVDIIRMRCVRYDHVFANDMKKRFPELEPELAIARQRKQQKASNTRREKRLVLVGDQQLAI